MGLEISGLKEISQEALICVENLIDEVNKSKEMNENLEQTMQKNNDELSSYVGRIRENLVMTEKELEAKQKEMSALVEQMQEMANSLNEMRELHERNVESLNEMRNQHEMDVESLNEMKLQHEMDVESLNEMRNQHEMDVESLNEMKSQHEKDVAEIEEAKSSISQQSNLLKALQMQCNLSEQKESQLMHQWTAEVQSLQSTLESKEKDYSRHVSELTSSRNALKQELEEQKEQLQSRTQYIQQMRVELRSLQAVIDSNDSQIDELQACVIIGDDDIIELKKSLVKLWKERQKLEDEADMKEEAFVMNLKRRQEESEQFKRDIEERDTQITQLTTQLNKLEGERDGLRSELIEKDNKLTEFQSKIEQFEKQQHEASAVSASSSSSIGAATLAAVINEEDSSMDESESELKMDQDHSQQMEIDTKMKQTPENEHLNETLRLQAALKESEDRVARLQQTIQSKYAEFKAMKESVKEFGREKQELVEENDLYKRKYAAAKKRIAHLEKNKLGEDVKEKVRQLVEARDVLKEENEGLRQKADEMLDRMKSLKGEVSGRFY